MVKQKKETVLEAHLQREINTLTKWQGEMVKCAAGMAEIQRELVNLIKIKSSADDSAAVSAIAAFSDNLWKQHIKALGDRTFKNFRAVIPGRETPTSRGIGCLIAQDITDPLSASIIASPSETYWPSIAPDFYIQVVTGESGILRTLVHKDLSELHSARRAKVTV